MGISKAMSIGERVKKRRLERGFSQTVLAKVCGCTQQTIAVLEKGGIQSPGFLEELAKVLEVSPEWLKTGEDPTISEAFQGKIYQRQVFNMGLRIRDTREALGISKKEICTKLGVDIETWEKWENGEIEPVTRAMIQWGKWNGVTLDWIYRGIGYGLPYSLIEKLADLDLRRRGIKKS